MIDEDAPTKSELEAERLDEICLDNEDYAHFASFLNYIRDHKKITTLVELIDSLKCEMDDIRSEIEDGELLDRDPYAYYGVRRSDF